MNKISSTNDFVIKFANVNGSGSASANQMFAKGVFRSGIPVSPKNIFSYNDTHGGFLLIHHPKWRLCFSGALNNH